MRILSIVLIVFICGCNDGKPHKDSHKEKFYRGDIVIHKLDKKEGIVIGKRYIEGWTSTTAGFFYDKHFQIL